MKKMMAVATLALGCLVGCSKTKPDAETKPQATTKPNLDETTQQRILKLMMGGPEDDWNNLSGRYTKETFDTFEGSTRVTVLYGMGDPRETISVPDIECPAYPFLLERYEYVEGTRLHMNEKLLSKNPLDPNAIKKEQVRGDVLLAFVNVYCQADPRAYKLEGIHPVGGGWHRQLTALLEGTKGVP